jgi:hypothetical protein
MSEQLTGWELVRKWWNMPEDTNTTCQAICHKADSRDLEDFLLRLEAFHERLLRSTYPNGALDLRRMLGERNIDGPDKR